jgi:predicted RNA-binding Zn-ribbon protein involved in translation (DUF1610 family)
MGIECETCGAPAQPGVLKCQYCGRPVSAELAKNAIPCPSCKELNIWGAQRCVKCQAWVVVQCVFCGAISPHTMSACMNCQEAFSGAPERKAAREAQIQQQQATQTAVAVGGVAASFLGAMAGGVLGGLLDD